MASVAPPPDSTFEAISVRGRVAFACASVEELAQHLALRGSRWNELVERMWRPVAAPPADWRVALPRSSADVSALFEPEPEPRSADVVRRALDAWRNALESAVDPAAATRRRMRTFVDELLALLDAAGAKAPDAGFFGERSPSNGAFGELGRAAPPVFFREGVRWEDLEPALRRGLCALSVARRREAAHALGHLGLPSRDLERVLARTCRDADVEVRQLSLVAWRRLFATLPDEIPDARAFRMPAIPDFRTILQERNAKWSPPVTSIDALIEALASCGVTERQHAIERCGPWLPEHPRTWPVIESLLGDPADEVRMTAALWYSAVPFHATRLARICRVSRDDGSRVVRAAAMCTIGTWGPRAADAVPTILHNLGEVSDPAFDPMGFYAAEALEEIGAAGFQRVVAHILSGRWSTTEKWLESLSFRPDLANRVIEEITRQANPDEAWLHNRIRRAIDILRPAAR